MFARQDKKTEIPAPADCLPGRAEAMAISGRHAVTGDRKSVV